MHKKSGPKIIPSGDAETDRRRELAREKKSAQRAKKTAMEAVLAKRQAQAKVKHSPTPAMTSADFEAAGGVIEVLPGIQESNVYARRRPVTLFRGAA